MLEDDIQGECTVVSQVNDDCVYASPKQEAHYSTRHAHCTGPVT
jgi:hypothetical protein